MKAAQIYLLLHVILTVSVMVHAFNPFEEMFGRFKSLWSRYESCDSKWISFNATGEHVRPLRLGINVYGVAGGSGENLEVSGPVYTWY